MSRVPGNLATARLDAVSDASEDQVDWNRLVVVHHRVIVVNAIVGSSSWRRGKHLPLGGDLEGSGITFTPAESVALAAYFGIPRPTPTRLSQSQTWLRLISQVAPGFLAIQAA